MGAIDHFFQTNLDIVFFVYGMAFLLMGIAILLQPKKLSKLSLAHDIWLLAMFGLTHGINELLDMWAITRGSSEVFAIIRWVILVTSYIFLFAFGRRFFEGNFKNRAFRELSRYAGPALGAFILTAAFLSSDFWKTGSNLSRYFLGFPGGLLTGLGLLRYKTRETQLYTNRLPIKYFNWAGGAFLCYALLSGLVVNPADYFPANTLNTQAFLALTGIPVQVFRALCAVAAAYGIVRILSIFNWEVEEKLHETIEREQTRFSDLAQQIPDSVLIAGLDEKITYVNHTFEKVTGYTKKEVMGKNLDILKNGNHEDSFYRNIQQTLASGQTWRGQITNKKKDGALYTEDAVIFPVLDKNGQPAEFVGISKDITDKLLAEEKSREYLQTSEIINKILKLSLQNKPLAEILQNTLNDILSVKWLSIETKGAIFLTDEKTNFLKMAASTGLGEFITKICAEVPAGRCLCGRALLSGKPVFKSHLDGDHENSYEGIHNHGHYVIPITAGGRVYGVITVYTKSGHIRSDYDINFLSAIADILAGIIRRVKLNERLALLKELRLKALETRDTNAALKLLTDNICDITGWEAGEVWLPSLNKLHLYRFYYHGKSGHKLETFASQSGSFIFKKGEGLPGVVWQRLEPVWFREMSKCGNLPRKKLAMAAGLKSGIGIPIIANGEFIAAITFLATEVKIGDEEMADFIGEAAGQLDLIFQQNMLAEQLVQTQKMDTVGQLAGGIAHDFNNILGAILGYTDFLIKDLKTMPRQLSDALEVKKAAERAAALTKQLLTFSRKKTAIRRVINLNDAIKELVLMLEKIIGENIKLEIALEEGVPPVKMDPTQLEQIIMNLVLNARDAMPKGGAITIKTGKNLFAAETAPAGLKAGNYAVFSVSDTGSGMSEEIKKRVFEPFFTTKPIGSGTGLGLSIVYGMIKQHNAQIIVNSVLDEGTTFTVFIPAASESETTTTPENQVQDSRLKGSETILIAEDDETSKAVLLRVLKEHGYNALAASNAMEALSLAKEHTGEIQLLLTDIRMPGKTGIELAEEMLKLRHGIKLLYMTGYTDTDILDKHHISNEALLHKPLVYQHLLAKIREMLDKL
ncbi:MAG TPA: hypothetical protein DCL44_05985 [Elusimicrobia bacterium]|nr:hypothetical protein [Elusimicrobiota bacterium]